ncbi:MAG TPA: hypothetical protein VM847_19580, partial [Tahibacter sp.]|nr:hypothetical protein [Tahibacter sp.]
MKKTRTTTPPRGSAKKSSAAKSSASRPAWIPDAGAARRGKPAAAPSPGAAELLIDAARAALPPALLDGGAPAARAHTARATDGRASGVRA